MKNAEIISLSQEELAEKIALEVENLQKLKFAHAISPLENPMKIREAKKLIARLKTEESSRNLSN
jgi:large subunit ribosomal protein L29